MVFQPPKFVPAMADAPDTVSICDFMFDEKYGRYPISQSLDTYTCGLTGRSISAVDQKKNVEYLARALAKELDWKVNEGSEWDKVACIFALNSIDIMGLSWAIHRLNGVSTPANAMYSSEELRHQMISSGARSLFTSSALLPVALKAASAAGITQNNIYICEMPGDNQITGYKTLSQLLKQGRSLPDIEPSTWAAGQGARQTAFLCYSSGTSGLPKGVMITHRNVIANTIQTFLYEKETRAAISPTYRDVCLGLLPQSHIYGLIIVAHASTYRGDQVIVLPKFEIDTFLQSIARYKINTLYVVPPIVITMINNLLKLHATDLSSVHSIFSGAAPLGKETSEQILKHYPHWKIRQAYGMTESCVVVTSTSPGDIWLGSSGCVLPGFELRLMDPEGNEIIDFNKPGEVLVKSPSIVTGYLNNEKATRETFIELSDGRYLRTGDEGEFRLSPGGTEHLWIVDRIKELIKVKGHQVAPAELESCLLSHPHVADCAVIQIPDERSGEVPKAYVVKRGSEADEVLSKDIQVFIQQQKARHKWLAGGIEFVDVIPKSPSGKILRRLLRDREAQRRRAATAARL